ncbi:MAG TPA: hypothetical protein VJ729_09770 [Nitrososphaeraceae archaeon]|nr:hypothetical protein [Nitrososphaeraceae archaeon]
MSNIISIFAVFSVVSGILIFGIWSNIQAYAQQQVSSSKPLSAPSVSPSTTISPQVKAIMCTPGSPSLKVVNTTEARICGIPKTVKTNTTTAAAILSRSNTAISSPSVTTKVPSADMVVSKQQKITTTQVASQLPKQTTGSRKETTTAVSNKPSLTSIPSTIAPQVNAISKKDQQQEQLHPTTSNVPAGRNFTFATTSPAVTPDTVKYLGYQGSVITAHSSSDSKDKHSSNTKSSSSSSHNDGSGKSSSQLSIINDISSVVKKSFNYKHSRHFDSSDIVSYPSDSLFGDNFPFTASASSNAIAGGASATASASASGG